jgi:tetratricopeptide (TPR) repeat protein
MVNGFRMRSIAPAVLLLTVSAAVPARAPVRAEETPPSPAAQALDLYQRAVFLLQEGRLEEAEADLTRAITLAPSDPDLWEFRGQLRAVRGAHDQAVEDFTGALALDPSQAHSWGKRAESRLALGRGDEALSDLSRAIELGAGDPRLFRLRALERMKRMAYHDAVLDLREVLRRDPDDEFAILWLLECNRAEPTDDGSPLEELIRKRIAGKPRRDWSRILLSFAVGEGGWTEEKLLAEAQRGTGESDAQRRRVQARYYAAQERIHRRDYPGARALLAECLAPGLRDLPETGLAEACVRRLDAMAPREQLPAGVPAERDDGG